MLFFVNTNSLVNIVVNQKYKFRFKRARAIKMGGEEVGGVEMPEDEGELTETGERRGDN